MHRYRFRANENDPRPVIFPPNGPWWCTGYGDDYATVVAYCRDEEDLLKHWPEATSIDDLGEQGIVFSERFPKPDWWDATLAKEDRR